MKRYPELIRDILFYYEEKRDRSQVVPKINDWTEEAIVFHVVLLIEVGYINGKVTQLSSGVYMMPYVSHLTWEGFELLDNIRDKEVWKKITQKFEKVASFSFPILQQLAASFVKESVGLK